TVARFAARRPPASATGTHKPRPGRLTTGPPQRGCCMTLGSTRIGAAVERRLQTPVGKRFGRFILVAAGAVIASQVTLAVCLGPIGWTAGRSALTAWLAGAALSYVLSRWAWGRQGRPHLPHATPP